MGVIYFLLVYLVYKFFLMIFWFLVRGLFFLLLVLFNNLSLLCYNNIYYEKGISYEKINIIVFIDVYFNFVWNR